MNKINTVKWGRNTVGIRERRRGQKAEDTRSKKNEQNKEEKGS